MPSRTSDHLQPKARVYAECNSVLHSRHPGVLHSAGGLCITRISKWVEEGGGGGVFSNATWEMFVSLGCHMIFRDTFYTFVLMKTARIPHSWTIDTMME